MKIIVSNNIEWSYKQESKFLTLFKLVSVVVLLTCCIIFISHAVDIVLSPA